MRIMQPQTHYDRILQPLKPFVHELLNAAPAAVPSALPLPPHAKKSSPPDDRRQTGCETMKIKTYSIRCTGGI